MTPEQKSRYEEAAKAHFDSIGRPDDGNEMRAWLAGASHAAQEERKEVLEIAAERDDWKDSCLEVNRLLKARDKTIEELRALLMEARETIAELKYYKTNDL
jgi:hypothetical protein